MVSRFSWDDLLSHACVFSPPRIHFPIYSDPEMMAILFQDCPADQSIEFFQGVVQIIFHTFKGACNDIGEFRYLTSLIFPKFLEPIKQGRVGSNETAKLFTIMSPFLKAHLESLYLRNVSSVEWESRLENKKVVTKCESRGLLP
jgi:hypothetical protein